MEQKISYFDEGIQLLESKAVSHNYLYFTLGAVPVLIQTKDHNRFTLLFRVLTDFFTQDHKQVIDQGITSINHHLDRVSMLLQWCLLLQEGLLHSNDQQTTEYSQSMFLVDHLIQTRQVTKIWSQQGIKLFEKHTNKLIEILEKSSHV